MVYGSLIKQILLATYHVIRRTFTIKYPFASLLPAKGYRGKLYLDISRCTGCQMCFRACPNDCIEMVAVDPYPEDILVVKNTGLFPMINFSRCAYCKVCVDACPTDCLYHLPEYRLYERNRGDFVQDPVELSRPPDVTTLGNGNLVEPKALAPRGAGHFKIKYQFAP